MSNKLSLPTLYKKTSTGAMQEWTIYVNYCEIHTTFGQVDGKLQTTTDVVKEGKNIGKKNQTDAVEQARLEARAKWEKKKKSGYVERMDDAEADALDELIEGGIVPMLAHKFSEQGHKIKLPCFTQPKLDGIRCIAIVKDGECTLWSRTRKPITSCPHIVQELEAAFARRDIVLDGELYNHEMKKDFEKIVSLVRKEEPGVGHEMIQYHVYDTVNGDKYEDRLENLDVIFAAYDFYAIKQVPTEPVNSDDDVMIYFKQFREMGYEGAMLRNAESKYVNKRSYDLQKVKECDDAEFKVIGVEEGRGKLIGHVGAFVCVTSDGKEFKAKMSGDTGELKKYFENSGLWEGKLLTVEYYGLTGHGVPRFPVGIRFRLAE